MPSTPRSQNCVLSANNGALVFVGELIRKSHWPGAMTHINLAPGKLVNNQLTERCLYIQMDNVYSKSLRGVNHITSQNSKLLKRHVTSSKLL